MIAEITAAGAGTAPSLPTINPREAMMPDPPFDKLEITKMTFDFDLIKKALDFLLTNNCTVTKKVLHLERTLHNKIADIEK
jgi:hypothetical protein